MNTLFFSSFRPVYAAALLAGAAAITGCSTMSQGMGGGELQVKGAPDTPVLLSWQSNDGGISGSMVATLPDATYTGSFLQVTHQTEHTAMGPLWTGWREGWGDWGYWRGGDPMGFGMGEVTRFSRDYSGKVVANLQSADGQRMRCRFHMNDPAAGMSGGGAGECQAKDGQVVSAVIDRS